MLTQAQQIPGIAPLYPDEQAEPVGQPFANVQHTGTDAIMYQDHVLQAMTWDDGQGRAYLSWAIIEPSASPFPVLAKGGFNNPGVSFQLPTIRGQSSDPDVVLAYDPANPGELYANVVYVDGRQTQYIGYHWNGSGFDNTPDFSVALGDPNPAYEHAYPNLDANAQGLVALTWQQSVDDDVTVTVASNSSYFASYSFVQHVTFSRTYFATGDIRGNIQPCTISNGFPGILVKDPPTGLFEQTLHPDIAISEGSQNDAVVSSTFIRHYVDGDSRRGNGLFKIINRLSVRQYRYRCGHDNSGLDTVATHEWAYSENDILGSPRIAAPGTLDSNGPETVEIVVDRSRPDCGTGEYSILNYSKYGTVFRPVPTLLNPTYTSLESVEPVISYSNQESQYTVSWAGRDYNGGNERDVWAVSMKAGGSFTSPGGGGTGAPQPLTYSRVNLSAKQTQWRPSLAGRHITPPDGFGITHLFADIQRQQVSFRYTKTQASTTTPLRPGRGNGGLKGAASKMATGLLEAYPNPLDEATSVTLRLQPGEELRRVLVTDLTGRQVADLTPVGERAPATGQVVLTWKSAAVPAGVYTLRAVTSQRTETVSLTRK